MRLTKVLIHVNSLYDNMMKNYLTPFLKSIAVLVILILSSVSAYGQLRVPFTQRTSQYTPGKVIYNIKGDFTMIGNSNLTLQNYGTNTNNSNNSMVFIDEDNDLNTSNSSSATLDFSTENGANPECSNIIYAGLYWTGRGGTSLTEQQMRTVKFKGPNDSNYTTLTASANDIMYPGDNNMYAGYIEVTDRVRNNGIGEYFVADIAITEGNGGATGYYGGWGMIVVYENSKMNWRDVTIFDGYAYVQGNVTQDYEIPVSGFNAVQTGDVNIKLGLMAGEGDRGISGDYFQIIHADEVNNNNPSANDWETLSHSGNSTNNFFNSSINTGGNARSPSLTNNTGLDIAMFDLDNSDKSLIDNSQTETRFRYGTTQDTYIIFSMAMSVDAYIPESEGVLSTTTINGNPPTADLSAEPGDEIEYKIEIKNKGTEPILNAQLIVPIPFTSEFVPGSISYGAYLPAFAADPPYFDPNLGATGSIVWDINFLPLFPADIDLLLADLTFKLKATEDCSLLLNDNCEPKIVIVGGTISGTGMISGTDYSLPLIQSYQSDGICQGEPNTDPIEIDIDADQYIAENCTNVTLERDFFYCSFEGNNIPVSELESEFPPGTRFYNSYPVTGGSTEYTDSNPFPATLGVSTYYGVPPGDYGCHYEFTIEVSDITTFPTVNDVEYCKNETASPLTGQSSNPDYVVVYFTDNNPNTVGQLSLTPDTSQSGTFTYYVSEGPTEQCVNTDRIPITVTVYDEISIVLENLENVDCYNGENGSIDISVSGGSGNYTYDWDYNGTETPNTDPQDLNNLSSGIYTVTVNDSNSNCSATTSFTISQPTEALSSTITSITDVLCHGEATGAIDLTITGGTGPYSILWNNGSTDEDQNNLTAGTYNVTITDANGCSTTNQATISQPTNSLSANITNINNVSCKNGTDGSFNVNVTGGTSPYQYSIDNGTTNQNNDLFENLSAGTYNVLVTDANNCTANAQVTITEPEKIKVSITNVNNVDCSGEATGDISISVYGGTQPYTYSWSNSATTQNLTDVVAGTYSVTVTDANGCTASANTTISEPSSPISLNISKVDANTAQGCTNGEATANVSGGTSPYTYAWSASANNQTTSTATNLHVGSHSVTITDANGCELTQSIVISCVNTCDAEISIGNITNVLCVGDATGSGTVTASSTANPSATFTFTWSNGQVDAGVTSSTINNITAGVYDVSVTIDGTVCQPVEETISISEPNNALNLTASSTDELGPNTNDGTASATATGGVEPYTYQWSPGGETTQNISGLASGSYTVTVTDANGCTETATVTVNPGSCHNLSISGTSSPVTCNGESNGSVSAVVTNGVGPFTYSWDTLPNTTPNVNNLPAGSYTVTVTDQTTLCTQSTTITVNEPNALSSGIAVTNILCKGDSTGSVDLTVNGGTPPYSYSWNNGATTEDLVNVTAGTYSVTITDANGCTSTNQSTVQEPNEIVSGSIVRVTNVDCTGETNGSISAEAAGGIPPYSYSIDNGATSQSSGVFENLAAGNYSILITDANGCTTTISDTVNVDDTEDPVISVPASITIEGCSENDITNTNAVFEYSNTTSSDIQSVFTSNPNYNASDDFNIASITYIDVIISASCPVTIERTFIITDNCGNTANADQTITVVDTTDPTINVPADVTIECTEDESSANTGVATGADTCGTVTITESDVETAACGNTKTIVRTWTVTDECGNSVSADQTITVVDTTDPTINVPADITIECTEDESSANTGVATGADTCGTVTITESDVETAACGNTKTIVRTWTVTDECGNSVSADQTITVVDTTDPTISVPADITIECTEDESSANTGVATGADTCGTVTITESDVETAACGNTKTIVRTWTVTDECGNSVSADQTITVVDTTDPTISAPADVTIECTEDESSANTGAATGADTCGTVTITESDVETAACGNTKTIVRTWTVTDACGNSVSADQTITVVDTTDPTINVPADITIECTEDESSANTGVATGADTCGTVTITESDVETAACGNTKTIVRTWTVTDECGNSVSADQTITVVDTTPPTFNEALPTDLTVECDAVPTAETLTANDNCGDATVTFEETTTAGTCDNDYTLTRTWTASDACGNETVHTQIITVQDTTAPTFNEALPADVTVECDAVPTADTLTANDNCGDATVTFEEEITNGACMGDYIIERTWIATDACGNDAIHIQIITVQDTTPPDLVNPFDENILTSCDDIPEVPELVFEDSCSNNISVSFNEASTQTNDFEDYSIIRTWTVTDDCGNVAEFTQNITVEISNVINAFDANRCVLDSEFDLFDLLSGDFSMDGTWSVVSGDATIDGSLFDPSTVEVGIYTFIYSITDGPCPTEVEVNVTIDDDCVVLPCGAEDVVISKTVTANGDSYNEFFTITGVEDCGFVIELQIFNRWGAEIYKNNNYQNDWNGDAHGSSVGNSGKVPTGTYYYVINLKNSGLKPFAGPIYVATDK